MSRGIVRLRDGVVYHSHHAAGFGARAYGPFVTIKAPLVRGRARALDEDGRVTMDVSYDAARMMHYATGGPELASDAARVCRVGPAVPLCKMSPTYERFRVELGKRFARLAPDVWFTDVKTGLEGRATWAHCDREVWREYSQNFVINAAKLRGSGRRDHRLDRKARILPATEKK
jgi:hypothetical protein